MNLFSKTSLFLVIVLLAFASNAEEPKKSLKSILELKKIDSKTPSLQPEENQKPFPLNAPVEEKEEPEASVEEEPINNKSVFFTDTEIQRLNTVYSAYRLAKLNIDQNTTSEKSEGKDVLDDILANLEVKPEIDDIATTEILVKAPIYFYLSSIFYRSNANSSVWLNGEKLSVKESFDGVSIKNISPDRVDFEWRVSDPNIDLIPWKEKTVSSNSEVKIDVEKRLVNFSLSINQTFNVRDMIIEEGKKEILAQGAEDLKIFYDPSDPASKFGGQSDFGAGAPQNSAIPPGAPGSNL